MIGGAEGARRPAPGRAAPRDVRGASRRFDEALVAARREAGATAPEPGGPRAPVRRPLEPRRSAAPALREAGADPARAGAPPPGEAGTTRAGDAARVTALRAAVRALPAAIEAARLHDGAQLTLALGHALGVELRGGAAGVEVTLRPAAALAQAAAAELPALVAALEARGVRVARAGVGSDPGARRPPGPPPRRAR